MKELTKQERTVYDELCKGTRQLDIMYDLKINKYEMFDVMNHLVAKGYIRRDGNGRVRILRQSDIKTPKKAEKKPPINIESTWSQSPPLKHSYEKANSEVVRWNWHELPADHPERKRIESLFRQRKAGESA